MKKLFLFILLIGLIASSVANAGTRLKGKSIYDAHKRIVFTEPSEQTLDNKLKVTAISPITDFTSRLGIKPSDPNCPVYYFRAQGLTHLDYVIGVNGISLRMENLTDNVLVVHWNESVVQIGNTSSMPFINGMKYIDAGKPSDTPNTVIPPKSFVNVDLYPATNVQYQLGEWKIMIAPLNTSGTTQASVTMKVEENNESKYYSYKTPCMNFPADFLAQYISDKQ